MWLNEWQHDGEKSLPVSRRGEILYNFAPSRRPLEAMTLTENTAPAAPLVCLNELPEHSSVSDLREILRRAVLAADDTGLLATSGLLAEVGSGRYRATSAEGMYL